MSLPQGGQWPPHPHGTAFSQQAIWSAWLVGDPEGLSSAYGGSSAAPANATYQSWRNNSGGVIPSVARFFWGRPSITGQRRNRLHVPLAADIATGSADLLFSEPPQFVVAGEDDARAAAKKAKVTYTPSKTAARVDEYLNTGNFHAMLLESGEVAAALGGCWLRLCWDKDIADYVVVDTVSADAAYGEWRWGKLMAVTFFTEYIDPADTSKSKVTRHLERHEPGAIYHGLYVGGIDTLGHPEPLTDHESTRPFAELVDEEGAISTGVKGLTAAYAPNVRPQRRWRKIEGLAELGRSDYDGCEPLMDALDETYTSWMRDLRLAKARLLVPEFMLKNLGKGAGATFDEDQEIFTQLNIAPTEGGEKQLTAQQFEIRVDDHEKTANRLVAEILDAAGYSQRHEESQQTATEVVARQQKSARTRDKKCRYWTQALEPLLTTWVELDALVFGTSAKGAVKVQWPDASQPDQEALGRTLNTLSQAQAASVQVKVAMLHPDWDEEDIAAEVQRIRDEQGMSVPDLGPLGGTGEE